MDSPVILLSERSLSWIGVAGWVRGCSAVLTVTLMVLAAFAVPDRFALADSGTDCGSMCSAQYASGTQQYNNCLAQCQNCDFECTETYGSGTAGWQTCMNQCASFLRVASNCPSPISNSCPLNNGTSSSACGGIGCANAQDACWCVWDGVSVCSCP
jgi:hypothetical protein